MISLTTWLRDLCGLLWAVAGLASILLGMMALSIQRDRRKEQSINAQFDDEFSEMYDAMEKNKNTSWAQAHLDWREVHIERRRAALSYAEASRWESAGLFWMLATGCALAAVVMLYASK